jgi:hypothetical protein
MIRRGEEIGRLKPLAKLVTKLFRPSKIMNAKDHIKRVSACMCVVLGVIASEVAMGFSAVPVLLDEGQSGRSAWGVWLDAAGKKSAPDRVCLELALERPSAGGLLARSESRECVTVSASAPVVEAISGGRGKMRRTVVAVLFAPSVQKVYLNIGQGGGKVLRVRNLPSGYAERLRINEIGFLTAGMAGNACLHRLIAYDRGGNVLSDSEKFTC